jgi:hypothetical protein
MEVVEGKRGDDIAVALADILGRDSARYVALDLCDPYVWLYLVHQLQTQTPKCLQRLVF